jgi:hypothetical protein
MSNALHLYGIIGNGTELKSGPVGLDGHRVSAICHRNLAALVSPTPIRAYKFMKREEVVPYLFAHQAVIEQVMEHHTVIPVKFGTIARDGVEVRKILKTGCSQLEGTLEAMTGRIELDLVAQWKDLNPVLQGIGEEEEIRGEKAAIASRPVEQIREERVRIGKLVKARLDQMRKERAAEITEALTPLALDICPHALLDDRMILNTAFLVTGVGEEEVGGTLERLDDRYGGTIDFRCVGPLPPYSFATVEVKTFEFVEVDRARRLLGLREWAALSEVKKAYRTRAHESHPDKVGDRIDGAFETVTEAYRLLKEYLQVGSSFRARDVREAVAVRLLQWSLEAGSA